MKEALFYNRQPYKKICCLLCNHKCQIKDGGLGICKVRQNQAGTLYSLNYGTCVTMNVDPIEKKPLYHFFPASYAYSIAAVGCNFKCNFCQNWQISQIEKAKEIGVNGLKLSPEEVVNKAIKNNCMSISYTYTEPTVYFEFAYDCAKLAKEKGLYNNFVTNGYMSQEALEYIAPYLDAANVDLKSYQQDFYRKMCKASLQPVLDNIALMNKLGIWVEITTLVIPGLNDSSSELGEIASFISSVDKNIPWHISRFHPDYKLTSSEATALSTLENAYKIGKEKGVNFIYIGNIHTDYGENTACPGCHKLIIERTGFFVKSKNIKDGNCAFCGTPIPGKGL